MGLAAKLQEATIRNNFAIANQRAMAMKKYAWRFSLGRSGDIANDLLGGLVLMIKAPMAPQSKPEKKSKESNSPTYTAQATIKAPRYIQDSATQDAVNNTLAQGHANSDGRFQVKQLDRAGLSRGSGQNFMAAQGRRSADAKSCWCGG